MITIVFFFKKKKPISLKYQVGERINTVDSYNLHHRSIYNDEVRAPRLGHGPCSIQMVSLLCGLQC
jgi:hypothetical protein